MSAKRFNWEAWVTGFVAVLLAAVIIGTYIYDKENIQQVRETAIETEPAVLVSEAASAVASEVASRADEAVNDGSRVLPVVAKKETTDPFSAEMTDQHKREQWYPCVFGLRGPWSRLHCYGECTQTVLWTHVSELLSERTNYGIEYTLHVDVAVANGSVADPVRSYKDSFVCHLGRKGQLLSVRKVDL